MRFIRSLLSSAAVLAACALMGQPTFAVKPEDMNMSTAKLDDILKQLKALVDSSTIPGASIVVHRGGQMVYSGSVGFGDREFGRPMTKDTICRLMSMSKPVTAVAAMILIERGQMSLKDPISKWNNKFRNMKVQVGNGQLIDAKREILVEDLFLHTGGFGYNVPGQEGGGNPEVDALSVAFMSLDEFISDLAAQPLINQPGTKWVYSWGYDVLGWVIEKVSGLSADEFMRRNLFKPLKMADTDFFVPANKFDRYMPAYTVGTMGMLLPVIRPGWDILQGYNAPTFVSGGAGLVSTALDYARFAQMLVNGGELDGARVLKPETVDAMWRNVLPADLLPIEMGGWKSDAHTGWALGWTISTVEPVREVDWTKHTGSKRTGAIGWGGGAMTNWMASADQDLVICFMTQRITIPTPNTFQDVVVQGVFKAITGPSPRALPGRAPANLPAADNDDDDDEVTETPKPIGGNTNNNNDDGQEVEVDPRGNAAEQPPKKRQSDREAERARKQAEKEKKRKDRQADALRQQQQQLAQQGVPQLVQDQVMAALQRQQAQQQQLQMPGTRHLRAP